LPTTQAVRLLLEAGASARGRSCYGGTPLFLACQSGDEEASRAGRARCRVFFCGIGCHRRDAFVPALAGYGGAMALAPFPARQERRRRAPRPPPPQTVRLLLAAAPEDIGTLDNDDRTVLYSATGAGSLPAIRRVLAAPGGAALAGVRAVDGRKPLDVARGTLETSRARARLGMRLRAPDYLEVWDAIERELSAAEAAA
jgi:ankyrin repeat protein